MASKLVARKKAPSKTARAKELAVIEATLGEEFSSLSEARKALHSESTPLKNSYTVRELSTKKHKTIRTFIPDVENHASEIDQLKRPQDFWAAEIYGYGTYSVHGSIAGLIRKIATYKGLQEENPTAALRNIKIIRIKGQHGLDQYLTRRKEQTKQSWKRQAEKRKLYKKREKKQATKLKRMAEIIKAQKAKIRQLEKNRS